MLKTVAGTRSRVGVFCAFAVFALGALGTSTAGAQVFRTGDLVVSAYGNSATSTADGQPTAISLLEFSPAGGSPISTFTIPTGDGIGGSKNMGTVGEYGSSSEGNLQPSGDGQSLTIGGYGATGAAAGIQAATNSANKTSFAIGTPYSGSTIALGQSADTDVPRIAITIDVYGDVNSSSVFNDLYNTNNPRSVYSTNGTTIYFSGQGDKLAADQGIFYAPVGLNTIESSGTPAGIYNAKDTRFVTAYGGNLYYSLDKSGSPTGIFEFSGLPTSSATATQITAASNGLSGSGKVNYSPEGFFFANATTLYVADTGVPKAGGTGNGGIQKWVYNGSSWILQYTFTNPSYFVPAASAAAASSGETGFEAITGKVVGNTVQLFAISYTAGDDNPDGLYEITDTLSSTSGAGQSFTELESAPGNGGTVFKGVALALTAPVTNDTPAMPVWALLLLAAALMYLATRFVPIKLQS